MKESTEEACARVAAEAVAGEYSEFGYSSEDVAALAEWRDRLLHARSSELHAADHAAMVRDFFDRYLRDRQP